MNSLSVKKIKPIHLALAAIIIASILYKWLMIRNYYLTFWYDQARDAHISRQIIEQGDLKLQGPSASGTDDKIYHGVLYYYFLAPLYFISGGNPLLPVLGLIVLSSLGVVPLYLLTKDFFNSKQARLLAVFLFALSFETAKIATWLSNPGLAVSVIILFYFCLWKFFYQRKHKFVWLLALSLGLAVQVAFWLLYLFIPLLAAHAYRLIKNKKLSLKGYVLSDHLKFFGVFFLTISTMIATQLKMIKVGIFKPRDLLTMSDRGTEFSEFIPNFFKFLLTKVSQSFLAGVLPANFNYLVGAILLFFLIYSLLTKFKLKQKLFLASWFLAPFLFILLHPRLTEHLVLLTEVPLYLLFAKLAVSFSGLFKGKQVRYSLIAVTAVLFVLPQLQAVKVYRARKYHSLYVQKGSLLRDQLNMLDEIYQRSAGEQFSFSSLSIPYQYNTSWSYLFDWHAVKNEYKKPVFVGPDQVGITGYKLLVRSDQVLSRHYTIIEPNTKFLPVYEDFIEKQNSVSTSSAQLQFGTLKLQVRTPVAKDKDT